MTLLAAQTLGGSADVAMVETDRVHDHYAVLDEPTPAVLTTYRKDGTASTSPVWFRRHGATLEVVVAEGDVKLKHLRRDSRCALLVFESTAPFRGVRVEGEASLRADDVDSARLSIATRYLGDEDGARFAESRGPGVVVALPLAHASSWDLQHILP